MVHQVSDTASNRRDQIANFAELLRNAPMKQRVFEAVYRGKKRVKTVEEVAAAASISTGKRVTEIAKGLVNEKLFEQGRERIDGRNHTVYRKIDFVATNKSKILQLARSKTKLDRYETKTNPKGGARTGTRLVVYVPVKIKTRFITIDAIDQFAAAKRVKAVPDKMTPERLSEKQFKAGILKLMQETKVPKDWGGETNDIFTTKLKMGGKPRRAAFALKGPAKKGALTPGMMGKNGDQIQRLFGSPADVFFVQYEGEIKESVIGTMEAFAKLRAGLGQEVWFGVIDLQDSYRLRTAYPKAFRGRA